jgi:uncharacterized membrane protein YoaK (UPF0700 family)
MCGHPIASKGIALTTLAFAAGCIDAVSYLALGHVFTANMTGNTVLLGIAAIDGSGGRLARSACALVGFCVGVALAARVLGRGEDDRAAEPAGATQRSASTRPACGRSALVLAGELAALAALPIVAATTSESPTRVYLLIGLSGMAMGAQSATVRAAGVRGIATTYMTSTLTGLVAGLTARPRHRRLAAAILLVYFAAALAGAATTRAWGLQAGWIAAGAIGLLLAGSTILAPAASRPDARTPR